MQWRKTIHLLRVIKHLTAERVFHQVSQKNSKSYVLNGKMKHEAKPIHMLGATTGNNSNTNTVILFRRRSSISTSSSATSSAKNPSPPSFEAVYWVWIRQLSSDASESQRVWTWKTSSAGAVLIDVTLMNVARPQVFSSFMLLPIYGILDRIQTVIMQKRTDIHDSPQYKSLFHHPWGESTNYWLTNQLSSNIPGASGNIAITREVNMNSDLK